MGYEYNQNTLYRILKELMNYLIKKTNTGPIFIYYTHVLCF